MLTFLIVVAIIATSSACSSDEYPKAEPRALTSDEADRLAVMRFNNFDRHYVSFTVSLTDKGTQLWLAGRADFRQHLAYANLLTASKPPGHALVQWNQKKIVATTTQNEDLPERPPNRSSWQARDLDPGSLGFDTALSLVLQLSSDRPENPLLLRQNGARWRGKANVGEIPVDVMTGPGTDNQPNERLTYFLDETGTLMKLRAILPSSSTPVVITLKPGVADPIKPVEQL